MSVRRRRLRLQAPRRTRRIEYYDLITTGDSSLSAVAQSIIAAEVGYHELAPSGCSV